MCALCAYVFGKCKKFVYIQGIVSHYPLAVIFTLVMPVISVFACTSDKVFDIIEITDFHGTLEDSGGNPVATVIAKNIKDVNNSISRTDGINNKGVLENESKVVCVNLTCPNVIVLAIVYSIREHNPKCFPGNVQC